MSGTQKRHTAAADVTFTEPVRVGGARTAEVSGDHVTGEAPKPWTAEGLRLGSANANHGAGSEHD